MITGTWQPDLFEAESRAAFQAAADNQVGFHHHKGAIPRMIPQGLPAMEQVKAALRLEDLPFDVPAPLPLATMFAVDTSFALRESAKFARPVEIRRLGRKTKQLNSLASKIPALIPEHVRKVASDLVGVAWHRIHCRNRFRFPVGGHPGQTAVLSDHCSSAGRPEQGRFAFLQLGLYRPTRGRAEAIIGSRQG